MAEACELDVRELSVTDVSMMAELYRGNPQYFEHTGEQPTEALARRDLADARWLHPEKKRMYGFFRRCWLRRAYRPPFRLPGRFMRLHWPLHGRPRGAGAWYRLSHRYARPRAAKTERFHRVRLAYIEANSQSRGFWEHCGFKATGDTGTSTVAA